MKRNYTRHMCRILLLMMVGATFVILEHHNASFHLKFESALMKNSKKQVFNATLLKFASIDIGEAKLNEEIGELLEGKFRNRGRQISFLSAAKFLIRNRKTASRSPFPFRSPEFYALCATFRKRLSEWSRKRKFHSDAMSDLVDNVKDAIDAYDGNRRSRKKYKTCAVVGNSGILLKSDYGKLIDSHEAVIRLNNARTANFEPFVGSRTSISFVSSNVLHICARREGCSCHPYGVEVPIITYICQPVHFMDYLVCNSSHKAPLMVTDPQFDVLCSRIVKYYSLKRFVETTGKGVDEWAAMHGGSYFHYSSGMQAIMVAAGICEKVGVFGFGKAKMAKHHYHNDQKKELSLHDFEAEYAFYKDLAEDPAAVPFVSDKFRFPPVSIHH